MADISGQIVQSAAPGALLRTTAEAQQQDPSKVAGDSQVGSPIRNLVQEPQQSNIPSTTPRVLNVVGPQSPTVDFAGLHDMLANAPVPPAHVAAQLIRALMTPGSGVVQPKAYVPAAVPGAPAAPNAPQGNTAPGASPAPAYHPSTPAVSPVRAVSPQQSQPVFQSSFGQAPNFNYQSTRNAYTSAPQQRSAQQTRQNVIGNHSFLGNTLQELGSIGSGFLGTLGEGLSGFNPTGLLGGILPTNVLRTLPGGNVTRL